jgi:hypothetical protein
MIIKQSLIDKVKIYLGKEGKDYFTNLLNKYGSVSPVYMTNTHPHSVHFNEGMQVRNFLRGCEECKDWLDHDFDNNWANIVEQSITINFKGV